MCVNCTEICYIDTMNNKWRNRESGRNIHILCYSTTARAKSIADLQSDLGIGAHGRWSISRRRIRVAYYLFIFFFFHRATRLWRAAEARTQGNTETQKKLSQLKRKKNRIGYWSLWRERTYATKGRETRRKGDGIVAKIREREDAWRTVCRRK